ncbi:MAG: hypothetical protein V4490_00915, partial [Pseudomonadota bacterium]
NLFQPNRVYEVTEFLGEFIIKDKGPTAIGTNKFSDSLSGTQCWAHSLNQLVQAGSHLYTVDEFNAILRYEKKQREKLT